MFDTSLTRVTYEQVLDFCRTFPEGVRVEYKREPANISKVISSFANTVGGIWVIGVDADKKTNRTVLPPLGLEGGGLEERIVQSAQSGIYPAITPAVRVFEVPDQGGRVLAVVKVPESIEAPHAIENSTRVWIRTASTTEPYELADIDRIEYLLKRRQEPERRREEWIQAAASRSSIRGTRVRVVVSPVYPRGVVLPYDELYERAQFLEQTQMGGYLRDFRTIHEGIAAGAPDGHYLALNIYGVLLFEARAQTAGRLGDTTFVQLRHLLYPIASVLNVAIPFFKRSLTNVLIRYEILDWQGIGYLHGETTQFVMPKDVVRDQVCRDPRVAVSVTRVAETLTEQRAEIVTELIRPVLWAFNHRPSADLAGEVHVGLKTVNLL